MVWGSEWPLASTCPLPDASRPVPGSCEEVDHVEAAAVRALRVRGCILTSTRRHPPCREVTLRTRGLSRCISGSCVGGTSGMSPLQGGEWTSVAFAFPCPWPEAQGPHKGVCLGAQAGSARCLLWGGMAGDGPLCEPAEGRAVWAAWSPLSYCRSPRDS